MRRIALLLACCLFVPAAPGAEEDEPRKLTLKVGEKRPIDGFNPVCDDPSVATIGGTESLSVEGVSVGTTLCSVRLFTGARALYKVVVVAKDKK